jgi:hypothetical protein
MKQKRDAIGKYSAATCGAVRYRMASCGNFAALCRSNRVQLKFGSIGRAVT